MNLTNEQIEQAVKCCSLQDCRECSLSEMAKKPPLICFDILFPNLVKYIERKNAEIKRLQECVNKTVNFVFYADEQRKLEDAVSTIIYGDENLKDKYEKLKSELWVLQEENRELKKDKERLKAYLKEKPSYRKNGR